MAGRFIIVDLLDANENHRRLKCERFRQRGLLIMPIRQYFLWVGSMLLVALFVADWLLPEPATHPHSQIDPHERVNLRIRSDHKWPERIVFDTTRSAHVAAVAAELNGAPKRDLAQVEQRGPLDAFAAMAQAAPAATNDKASAISAKPRSLERRFTGAAHAN